MSDGSSQLTNVPRRGKKWDTMKGNTDAVGDTVRNAVIQMREYHQETIDALFTRVEVSWPENANVRFVVSRPGELVVVRSVHSAPHSSSRRLERHMTDVDSRYYFACMPLNGSVHISHVGRDCRLKSRELGIIATDSEYEIEMSDYLDAIWLRIPAEILRSYVISLNQVLGRPLDASRGLGLAAQQLMCSVLNEGNVLSGRSARVLAQSLVNFVGELINSTVHDGAVTSNLHRQKILTRACEFIEAHLDDEELSPQYIARGVGISVRYLSEIFATEGISPMRWVQKRRLELCRKEIEKNRGAGQQLICEIAYSVGFTNVSSFNRAFKAQYGRAPSEFIVARSVAKSG